jgi:hypothetical protein
LRTGGSGPTHSWIWTDVDFCSKQSPPYDIKQTANPLQCYFGDILSPCPNDTPTASKEKGGIWWQTWRCPKYIPHIGNSSTVTDFSSSVTDYLFSQVNPEVVKLVEQEALKIFGSSGAPPKMITVHIR